MRRMIGELVHRGPDDDGFFERRARRAGHAAAQHHRPARRPPADPLRGRGRDRLQRRDLQLPRAARRARARSAAASAPNPTPRSCSRPTASTGIDGARPARGHVRPLHLRPARAASCTSPATGSASSRSTTASTAASSPSRARSRPSSPACAPRPALDRQAIHDYLTLRYVPSPGHRLGGRAQARAGPPAELRPRAPATPRSSAGGTSTSTPSRPTRAATTQREFEELFLAAVEKRLLAADVPSASCSAAGSTRARSAPPPSSSATATSTRSRSASPSGGEWSELRYARALASTSARATTRSRSTASASSTSCPSWCDATDEPLADLASIPLHFVSELAREHVKVVLSGEGADEVLAGYNLEQTAATLERWRRDLPRCRGRSCSAGARARARGPRGVAPRPRRARLVGAPARDRVAHDRRVFDESAEARPLARSRPAFGRPASCSTSWYARGPSAIRSTSSSRSTAAPGSSRTC